MFAQHSGLSAYLRHFYVCLRALGCGVDFLVHQPMIISYRGICFPESTKDVIELEPPKVTVSILCLLNILGSLRTCDTFMCGTWR
ncbi:hypothetical protein T265_05534 [Opisthorchis viverrini]|uniref:Uncharacterized protein n=1 Tax=Opisthorchis viverrini TaxID=6198 RepID=A0A074ZVM0_OPIVI|nr:hypothetical protein T265_05534 [Opisthorchis viverrini]KER27430.1 hypothetical protein T265_05534 [Opisthorchis viverrini]